MKYHHSLAAVLTALILAVSATAQTSLDDAAAALKAGDFAAADALLAPLVAETQPAPSALVLLSQVRLAQKNSKDAIALAERATQLAPTQADTHAQLGLALSARMPELGFMQQAMVAGRMRKAFEKAAELDPKNVNALIGLARYFSNAPEIAGGSTTKAAEYAGRVRAIDPLLGEIELGRIAERAAQPAEALQHYTAAVELKPDSANLHFACARLLAKSGRPADARSHLAIALQIKPDLAAARQLLAELEPSVTDSGAEGHR